MIDATDLASAIDDCSVDLVGTRFLPPAVEKGRVVTKPIEQQFLFRGSIQPLSGRELQRLPEGQRNQNRKKLYTSTQLRTVDASECDLPDRVAYRGATYQVDTIADWADLGGYFRVELVEMGQ